MMVILGIISAIFVVLSIILVFIRLMFDLRFTEIQQEPDQTPLFRRKVNHLRKIEQSRHIRYLLIACLMIGIGTVMIMGSFLILADNQQKMTMQTQKANQRIAKLEKQQKELIKSIPLKNYPENGIGLKEYEWDKLVGENKDLKLQKQIETAISQRSAPYFGSSDTKATFSEPKTLTLQLKVWTVTDTSAETIKKNIEGFVKEMEEVTELMAIHIQLITSNEKNEKVLYSVNYSREKREDVFHKKNVSEQNLKNDGGKG